MSLMRLDEAFRLNPTVRLAKGTTAAFVDMAALVPFRRDVRSGTEKPYAGGTKFVNGDVLMARITPSLENGKTSIYRASAEAPYAPAFGSTEFIVIRGRENVSDSEFAYYLFTSPAIREHAISSMNGSSGRQRVQQDSLASHLVELPSLPEQRAIADTLGALDDKIESNLVKRDLLRSLGQAEYIRAVSRGAETRPLSALTSSIARGVAPKYSDDDLGTPLVVNQKCIRDGWVSLAPARRMHDRVVAPTKLAETGDVLVNSTGTGTLGRVARWHEGQIFVDGHVSVVKANKEVVPSTVLAYSLLHRQADIEALATGSTGQTELSPALLGSLRVAFPIARLSELEDVLLSFETQAAHLNSETINLERIRDSLIPELMSGRIKVPTEKSAE